LGQPCADDKAGDKGVEFWTAPEREGWLMKQGEHIKTWRRRWFVLKQGRIFWFKEHRLTPQVCVLVEGCMVTSAQPQEGL
jgi:hypothetical protein